MLKNEELYQIVVGTKPNAINNVIIVYTNGIEYGLFYRREVSTITARDHYTLERALEIVDLCSE